MALVACGCNGRWWRIVASDFLCVRLMWFFLSILGSCSTTFIAAPTVSPFGYYAIGGSLLFYRRHIAKMVGHAWVWLRNSNISYGRLWGAWCDTQ